MAKTKKTSTGRRKATADQRNERGQTNKSATMATKKTARKTTKKTTQKAKAVGVKKKVKTTTVKKDTTVKKGRLDKKHLDEFRGILLQKRRTLLGDVNVMEERSNNSQNGGNLSSMPTHMADVGTDNFEHEFTLGLIESEQSLLKQINQAIQRVESGTYGICLGTGQRIPLARLRAKPWAKYTVKFAQMIEEGQAREPDNIVPEEK